MNKKNIIYFLFFICMIGGIAYFILNIKLDAKHKEVIQSRIITYPVEKLIEQNDIEALEILSKEGNSKAISYLEKQSKAKKQREAEQLFEIAYSMIEKGKIDQTTTSFLRISADNGYTKASWVLANLSFIGILGQDFDTAKQQYEILATSANPYKNKTFGMLSMIYFNGLGTEVDIGRAKSYFKLMLENEKDNHIIHSYQLLSNMGNKNAENLLKEFKLPIYSEDSIGMQNQIFLHKAWSEKEAKNNNSIALYNLAIISGMELKYDQAVDYAEQAIKYHLPLQYKQSLLNIFRTYAKIGNKKSRDFAMKLSQKILDNK